MALESVRLAWKFPAGRRPRWLPLLVALCAGASLAWASVHTRLESSTPAADEVLSSAPEEIELRFSGPVNGALSSVFIVASTGDSLRVSLSMPGADGRTLLGELPPLSEGEYLVRWRTVSADGHPVEGEFGFTVAAAVAPGESNREADSESQGGEVAPAGQRDTLPQGPGAGRVLLAGLGLACLLGFAGLLWYCGSLPFLGTRPIGGVVRGLGWAALFFLAGDLLGWVVNVAPTGSGSGGITAALGSAIGLTGLGRVLLVGLALATVRRNGRVAAGLALVAVVLGAFSGHSATISPWITAPANAIHLGAASIWLGGLLLLALVPGGDARESGTDQLGPVVRAVSSAALLSVVLIAASGMIQSAVFVGGVEAFTGSTYGRGVLAKWGGLAALIGFGAFHRLRVLPRLAESGDGRGLRRTVRVETIVMLAVVMLAAWLARVSPPAWH
ncbi:MAG: copper resistance protein CopC/CopD [marine benthic group bacterium]|nr:copper resistance protein CopC/CopD [Candidatus Benthicola marisminoris]